MMRDNRLKYLCINARKKTEIKKNRHDVRDVLQQKVCFHLPLYLTCAVTRAASLIGSYKQFYTFCPIKKRAVDNFMFKNNNENKLMNL